MNKLEMETIFTPFWRTDDRLTPMERAVAYGLDLSLIAESLIMTPEQRMDGIKPRSGSSTRSGREDRKMAGLKDFPFRMHARRGNHQPAGNECCPVYPARSALADSVRMFCFPSHF